MEEDPYSPRPVARWFIVAAVASLLFMGLGCISYLMHVFVNPATGQSMPSTGSFQAIPTSESGS